MTTGWVPAALAYGAATLTGVSRLVDDKHWLTDVVTGAVVGTLVSKTVAGAVNRALNGPRTQVDPSELPAEAGRAKRSENARPTVGLVAAYPVLALEVRF